MTESGNKTENGNGAWSGDKARSGNGKSGGTGPVHVTKERLEDDFNRLEFSPLSAKEVWLRLDELFEDLDSSKLMNRITAQVELCKLVLDMADNALRPSTANAMRKKISEGISRERWELFLDRLVWQLEESGRTEIIGSNGAPLKQHMPVENIRVVGELAKLRDFGPVGEKIRQQLERIANSGSHEHAVAAREALKTIQNVRTEIKSVPKNGKQLNLPVGNVGLVGTSLRRVHA